MSPQKRTIMTDEVAVIYRAGKRICGPRSGMPQQGRIQRPAGRRAHTNTAESFFALFNRGWYGIFHWYSRQHTHRYCNEFAFRWDHRKVSDGERMVAAIKGAEGKRLMYG